VRKIDIEKKLPDTLRIKIRERQPIAIARFGERLLYVDHDGAAFSELSPSVGDRDLPLIVDASGPELIRSVRLLESVGRLDPQMYARISEVRPIPPRGFAIFDRELGAVVYVNADDASAKYRELRAVLEAENNPGIEYADLRFADRVIVKAKALSPSVPSARPAASAAPAPTLIASGEVAGRPHVQN
jgi:cell division protein FtsQ